MKSRAAKSVARLAALAAACVAFVLLVPPAPAQDNFPAPSDADHAWVQKIFPVALDEFFPIEHAEGDFIAVRSHQEGLNRVPSIRSSSKTRRTRTRCTPRPTKRKAHRSSISS